MWSGSGRKLPKQLLKRDQKKIVHYGLLKSFRTFQGFLNLIVYQCWERNIQTFASSKAEATCTDWFGMLRQGHENTGKQGECRCGDFSSPCDMLGRSFKQDRKANSSRHAWINEGEREAEFQGKRHAKPLWFDRIFFQTNPLQKHQESQENNQYFDGSPPKNSLGLLFWIMRQSVHGKSFLP